MKPTGNNDLKPKHGSRRLAVVCVLASLLGLASLPRLAAAAYDTWEGSGPLTGGAPGMSVRALAVSTDGTKVYAGSASGKVLTYAFAPLPVNGSCGSANGVGVSSAPSSNLCTTGTAGAVSGSGPWSWSCNGANGGTNASCSAPLSLAPVNGACGSAHGVAVNAAPTNNLCAAGTAGAVSGSGPWSWSCAGANGGTNASCSAPLGAVPVNGVCGGAHGAEMSAAPTSNLCAVGTAGAVSGSGPWTWTCAGANGGANAMCTAVLYSPPPPPPPPPTLPGGGGDLTLEAGGRLIISSDGGCGSTLTLTGSGTTRIAIGGGTLTIRTSGTTRFAVVCAADGRQALRIDDGSFGVGGGQQALLIAGGLVLSGQGANNEVTVLYVGGKLRRIAVTAGAILMPGNGFAAASGMLHAGEIAEFDASERVVARYLGSFEGNAGQLGDRLPSFSNALAIPAGVPLLSALPERQRQQGLSRRLDQQLSQVLQAFGLSTSGQDAKGVIRLSGNDSLYAALPLGRVRVAEGEANGLTFNADGSARAVVNGYAFQLVPAVADPGALASAMATQRPGTTAVLGGEGEWRFTESNGRVTVVRPGWLLSLSDGGVGLRTDATGELYFAHDSLFGSMLYPALADRARLLAAARQLDPAATLTSVAGGETVLTLSGKRYVLTPASVLVDIPAAHANAPFWLEGGKLYVPAGNGKAQGFGVR